MKTAPRKRPAPIPPGAFRAKGAAAYLSLSTASFARLKAAGRIPAPIRLGGIPIYPRATLDRWLSLGCPPADDFARLNAERN